MSDDRIKLAEETQAILLDAAKTMETQSRELVKTAQQRDAALRELRIMKLAKLMEDRGIASELDFNAKVAELSRAENAKLATMEQAIELSAGGFRLGSTYDSAQDVSGPSSGDPLEAYIMSGSAYNS